MTTELITFETTRISTSDRVVTATWTPPNKYGGKEEPGYWFIEAKHCSLTLYTSDITQVKAAMHGLYIDHARLEIAKEKVLEDQRAMRKQYALMSRESAKAAGVTDDDDDEDEDDEDE